MKRIGLLFIAIAALVANQSCNGTEGGTASGPSAGKGLLLVVVIDPTESAQARSGSWRNEFKNVLTKDFLKENDQVAFVTCDHAPEIPRSVPVIGFKKDRDQLVAAYDAAWKPKPCHKSSDGAEHRCGTDVATALERAFEFAIKPENAGFKRKLIVGYTDLVPDPCKPPGMAAKMFRDPLAMAWGAPKDNSVEIAMHGIPEASQSRFRAKCEEAFGKVALYGAGETLEPARHYGLKQEGFL